MVEVLLLKLLLLYEKMGLRFLLYFARAQVN